MDNKNIKFFYKDGVAQCTINYNGFIAIGRAKCHPDDSDMQNEHTGCEIAMRRASIVLYKHHKNILKIQLQALNQLYYSMKHSKRFNEKSYENVMLQRQINLIKTDLETTKEMIVEAKENLKTYIKQKDEFYTTIRANRAKRDKKANIE